MTRRTISTVRAKIERLRAAGKTWAFAAERAGVIKSDGRPDTGMAYQIAINKHEPIDPKTRERLGLIAICVTCKRPLPRPKIDRPPVGLSPDELWWRSLPPKARRTIIYRLFTFHEVALSDIDDV